MPDSTDVTAVVPLDNASEGPLDNEHVQETTPDPFKHLWNLGYRYLVPIVPFDAVLWPLSHLAKRKGDARGKAPGIRGADGQWLGLKAWQTMIPTEADLASWYEMKADVGLRLGLQHDGTYLFAVDADTLHRPCAELIAAAVQQRFGVVPVRIGQSPKALYLIRCHDPLPYRSLVFEHGVVEVLGEGKQCKLIGIHPKTKLPYRITRPIKGLPALVDLPLRDAAEIDALLGELSGMLPKPERVYGEHGMTDRASVDQERLKGDLELVRQAVEAIPNRYPADGYAWWIKLAAAVRGACQEDDALGLELFEDFTARAELGDDAAESATRVYRSINAPFAVGASLLFEWAEERSEGKFDRTTIWWDANPDVADLPSLPEGGGSSPKPPKFPLQPFDVVAASALSVSSKPLVDGLLDQGAMSVLYGASNTGKTFVAMDLSYHVAAGAPWGGMRTEQLAVVYIAAEGGVGARRRAAALANKYGPCGGFHFILSPVNLLDRTADLVPLVETLRQVDRLGLIVIDTLSRVLAGGEENSSVDMGALVSNFDAIRDATGAHVMVVHHTGKIEARGARGHSLLRAATDTEIEISEEGIRVTKQRDMDKCAASGFRLEVVHLGVDTSGRPVSSCTVRLIRPGGVEAGTPTPRQAEVWRALEAVLAQSSTPAGGVSHSAVAAMLGEDSKAGKEQVRNALGELAAKNIAVRVGRGAWATRDIHAMACFQEIDPPNEAPKKLGNRVATDAPQKGHPRPTLLAPSVGVFG